MTHSASTKFALVTGGTRGIGAGAAFALAQAGYEVLATGLTEEEVAAPPAHPAIRHARLDVTRDDQVAAIVATCPRLDALVNCAGIAYRGLLTDMPDATWHHLLATDLDSVFYLQRAVLPGMISRGHGAIVNVSSMWGEVGASCEAAYSAAKAGVIGLTKATAKEVGLSGIRVNCVTPGVIRTPMNAELSDDDLAALADETPLGRIGEPEECAEAILFLASEKASFITGQVLGVSGGLII